MKRLSNKIVLVVALVALSLANINAQTVPFVFISPDTQTIGMGGASVALDANAFALYNNPASIAMSDKRAAFAASYGIWQPLSSNNSLIGVSGFAKIGDKFGIGISDRHFLYQPYDIMDKTGATFRQFKPAEFAVDLGLSYKLIDMLSIGANLRYISSKLDENSNATALAADVAVTLKTGDISVALAAANLGSKIRYSQVDYSLSSMIKLGAAYKFKFAKNQRVSISAEGDYLLKERAIMAGFGAEYSFRELVMVRLGYHYGDARKAIPSYASAGLGLSFKGISVSAAYLIPFGASPLKNTLSVSLGYSF